MAGNPLEFCSIVN